MFLQQLITGLSVGSIYALMAVGYSLIYSLLNFTNFAHGASVLIGAYVGYFYISSVADNVLMAVVCSTFFGAVLAALIERIAYITLRVRGGSNRYSMVVPDSCEALISKHTVPGETPEKIIVDLQSAVQREKLHASFEFAVEKPFYPSFLLNDNLEEICRLRHIFEEVTGEELKLVCSDGVSDNNHWSTIGGIPSVCFGPGGKGLHQSDEWVSTEQMENVLEVYLRFFLEDEE